MNKCHVDVNSLLCIKKSYLCRNPQGSRLPKLSAQPAALSAVNQAQNCGKKDLLSPQARWGDDGARQVQTILQTACSTSLPQPDVARQFPAPTSAYSSSAQIAAHLNLDYCTHIQLLRFPL